MKLTYEEMQRTIRPLVYGVQDPEGVTTSIIKFMLQIVEDDRQEIFATWQKANDKLFSNAKGEISETR